MSTLLNGLSASSELAALVAQWLVRVAFTPAELSLAGACVNNVSGTSSTVCSSGVLNSAHVYIYI